jgi:tRNA A-37 threonylcarbamoyl transferase component Bud32
MNDRAAMPSKTEKPPALLLEQIGGYILLRELTAGQTWLVREAGAGEGTERQRILKKLESDCLLRGQLHPSIRERLARVREVAHAGVANLLGVEREAEQGGPGAAGERAGMVYLVWEHIPGRSLEAWLAESPAAAQVLAVARELVAAVESLHLLGIVHGALHERNVIIDEYGAVRLTHISPLLYNDPSEDAAAVLRMLREAVRRRSEQDTALGRALEGGGGAGEGGMALRRLGARLAGHAAETSPEAVRAAVAGARERDQAREIRRRAVIGAAGVAVLGGVVAYGLWHGIKEATPHPPLPQEASPAAMKESGGG